MQGSSPEYAAKLQADLESTKAKLESADETQLADLTKQDLVGDMLEATIFSYFAMNNIQDDITAQQAGIVNYRAPSYGKFSTSLTTSYWFGTPRNVTSSGLSMDVDKVSSTTVDKNNNAQAWVNFNQMIGNRYSAMEHLVPEQMFSTEEAPAEGISAVKAIAIAGAQGQKIWTITQDNLDVALDAINLSLDTEAEIRNSVNAGRTVNTHEQSINFNGWVGEGYIIFDPTTGAGAYKIAGGGNGAEVITTTADVINWISFAAGLKVALYAVSWGPHAGLVLAAINMLTTLISLGTSCPAIFDATALASIWFFTMAMMVIGVLIATLGPMGIAASIAMALMVQGASMFLGEAFASGC